MPKKLKILSLKIHKGAGIKKNPNPSQIKVLNTKKIKWNKIKKKSCQVLKKQKTYSKLKNVQKMPKKLKSFSLKIHKGAGI